MPTVPAKPICTGSLLLARRPGVAVLPETGVAAMRRHEEAPVEAGGQEQGASGRDRNSGRPYCIASDPPPSNVNVLDLFLDDEDTLRQAVAPLLDMAQRRVLSPPTEEATLRLLDAIYSVRRLRGAVEVAIDGDLPFPKAGP